MAIRTLKPITPGTRYYSVNAFVEITKSEPEKDLLRPLKKSGGRNNTGRITSRHRGGGHKRRYRVIDFRRAKRDMKATVIAIEYDPNRTAFIALLQYEDGEKTYILCPNGVNVGDVLEAGENVEIRPGNALPVGKVPLGAFIHNIEMRPGKGGQIARSAGTAAQLVARDEKYSQVKMPSSEVRLILNVCYATLGTIGNNQHENISYGKAGRSRWLGIRPQTRGMAMNPIDHPMGGGEGRSKSGGGRKHPRSPWGQLARGLKTRNKRKPSNKYIVRRRVK